VSLSDLSHPASHAHSFLQFVMPPHKRPSKATKVSEKDGELVVPTPCSLSDKIADLRKAQAKMKAERKLAAAQMRNATRKKQRIVEKCKQLSEDDLVMALHMRVRNANKMPFGSGSAFENDPIESAFPGPEPAEEDEDDAAEKEEAVCEHDLEQLGLQGGPGPKGGGSSSSVAVS